MRTFAQLCAVILLNEVEPRARKYGLRPPPELVVLMVIAERSGEASRHDTRRYLDAFYRTNR